MADLINRQAAIDRINKQREHLRPNLFDIRMVDREKVIKGLECAIAKECKDCPYNYDFNCLGCDVVLHDALRLLKEQPEQKHGHWILYENQRREEVENGNFYYLCSQCSRGDVHAKTQDVPYCWWCGAKMDEVKQDD